MEDSFAGEVIKTWLTKSTKSQTETETETETETKYIFILKVAHNHLLGLLILQQLKREKRKEKED